MKKVVLTFALFASIGIALAQTGKPIWKSTVKNTQSTTLENKQSIANPHLFALDAQALQQALANAPQRFASAAASTKIVSFPTVSGELAQYRVKESSNLDPELAARYPEIKSYIGQGVDNPAATIYFSVSPLGVQTMLINPDKSAEFIEPYTTDLSSYVVYRRQDKAASLTPFECKVIADAPSDLTSSTARPNADDATLRTFRLAASCTGEYAGYFGGTKALALAAINNSMTRVNGVFEADFAARMVLVANNDAVLYTSASTDPYTTSYNSQLQSTLTSVIGDANYDVGHLFVLASNNGNAGCIGCICASGKGSGFTAGTAPVGDTFDIDYLAHEIGHQFGGNHTFSMSNEGTGVNMEPGSGSTIMGYAGITSQDVQPNSDAYFHAISIQQITNNIKLKTCQTNTPTGNAVPTANAGLDYTIPKSTPFMLTGSGTDANGDVLTYNWEQIDNAASTATGASSAASATRTTGPTFRSYNSTTTPVRYFPRLQSILTGATTTAGTEINVEALPSVARTMNFRLTVRDNKIGGAANNSDDMIVTVNATAGPFSVTAPNTSVSYVGGSTQTITWNVAGTTANNVNCANVDILLSTNNGTTFTTLLAGTPNDGTQAVVIPNTPGTTNRIMVKGSNHIFFDISNANFTITQGSTDFTAPTAPTNLAASGTTINSTQLSWTAATDNVAVTGYDVYQGATLKATVATTSYTVTGLNPATLYSFSVKAKDANNNVSAASNVVDVTTLADTTAPSAPVLSASGTTNTTTNLAWTAATDNVGVVGYEVYQGTTLRATVTTLTYAVTGLTAGTSYAFNVLAKDAAGNTTSSNVVNVTTTTPDTTAPSVVVLSASGTTATTTNLAWTAATDNVGVTGYEVYQGATLRATVTTLTYAVTGLTASTAYTFSVKAKDAAGNASTSNTVSVTTLTPTITYCTSQGTNTSNDRISRVVLGTINNTSTGTAGYENFTAISTNLVRGVSNAFTITPFRSSSTRKEAYRIWIDYNNDGDFLDAGEQVYNRTAISATSVSGSFTVPTTTTLGLKRMRVSMKYNASPTSCEVFARGQVEDYTVNVTATARQETSALTEVSVYPNPVQGNYLAVSESASTANYRIYTLIGQEIAAGKVENNEIYVGSLTAGTYLVEFVINDETVVKRIIKK
ncbi:MAG: fibronectin type III domain-containing protein [Flavobacterium sp.]|nr:fibronectin type III domain-containing protein [Flavobacterium sp.]